MTNKEFYRELGNIDPKMIEAAASSDKVQKNRRISWIKWASIAACLTLCVLCAIPLITNFSLMYPIYQIICREYPIVLLILAFGAVLVRRMQ